MLRIIKIFLFLILFSFCREYRAAAQQAAVSGVISDSAGVAVENVSVSLIGTALGTNSGKSGEYRLEKLSRGSEYSILFSCVGYISKEFTVRCSSEENVLNVVLAAELKGIGEVTVTSGRVRAAPGLTRIPVKDLLLLPSASGSFEAVLKTLPGVSSHNELSSQYSVRGGSYDENLVYVNDVEIFRPFLIRSGQQEGLSFINPDLVSSVSFSAGGFDAGYGDRMSSVLDIRYRQPDRFHASVQLGLLVSSTHIELTDKTHRLTWIAGVRYKSSSMMLRTLASKGDYQPVFADFQSILTWKTGKGSVFSLLSSYASNTYSFIPKSMTSTFGTETEAYQLYVLFRGREKDRYGSFNNALSWDLTGSEGGRHKFILSSYISSEAESFDIRGYYRLDNLDKMTGSENFSDSIMNIGIGSFLSHARNRLNVSITTLEYKGEKDIGNIYFRWGSSIRSEIFNDRIREWRMEDSAGYSVPYQPDKITLSRFVSSENRIGRWSAVGWTEAAGKFSAGENDIRISGGVRSLFNSLSGEFLVTPRVNARITTPSKLSLWLSGGLYYQPPFYREMRFPDGTVNTEIKAQKSVHAVAGMSWDFAAWQRPFRLTGELYNKTLSDIIPYHTDNVRIIYSGENSARGFSRGIDLRLNGEFVEGAESWISVSYMNSMLQIPSAGYGYFPSPADQTFSVSLFFQDYFPTWPTLRAHINIAFATGLPMVSPFNDRYDQYYRIPSYRRVDLGFTKVIIQKDSKLTKTGLLKYFDELVAGIEIFNLLDINNTVSYFWVRTLNNLSGESRQYAIPDYLTGRCLNLRLLAKF
jgi:hypothetical protein